jgi:methyl-accepting chemotaxis protein
MKNRPPFKRRNYFINKKFQTDFSIKFLIILVVEAILAIGLFLYLSKGTLTTGYIGSELKIARTYDFFLPMLLFSNLVIAGVTSIIGIIVLIFISHRIAGPLYHFQKVLNETGKGDLTHRFTLRHTDQFHELADHINELIAAIDRKVGDIKAQSMGISNLLSEIQTVLASNPSADKESERLLHEVSKKLLELQEAANYFKTSPAQQNK